MRSTLVLLLVTALGVAAVNSAPQNGSGASSTTSSLPSFADALQQFIPQFKRIMPCGFAAMELPPLAPFRLPIVSLDINQELLVLNGSIKNMVLSGLSDFIVIELKTNTTTNRTQFDVLYKDVQLLGEYKLYVNADLAGYKFVVNLHGLMNLQVLDLRVNGGVTVGTNSIGGILLSDVDSWVEVGDVVSHNLDTQWSVALNDYFNDYVHNTAMMWLQTNRKFLNELISGYLTETVNTVFYNVTPSDYLEAIMELTQEMNSTVCTV